MSKNNGWISFRECRPCDSGYYLVFTEYDKTKLKKPREYYSYNDKFILISYKN